MRSRLVAAMEQGGRDLEKMMSVTDGGRMQMILRAPRARGVRAIGLSCRAYQRPPRWSPRSRQASHDSICFRASSCSRPGAPRPPPPCLLMC